MLGLNSVDFTETMYYKQASRSGEAGLVLGQLAVQCGGLSGEQKDRVRSLSSEQLSLLGAALLRFTGMGDLERWLGENLGE
ncbi:MAG: DUF4351 domain-containing protein [Alkalinema sp. RU_4_3]|nr:DUF4351 domain-containing protein [Alkalinema sp. RU_4_3]